MTGHVMVTKGGGCGGEGKGREGRARRKSKPTSRSTLVVIQKKKKEALVASLQNDDVWLRIEGKIGKKKMG
jgi:hypothetical protein